MEVQAVYISGNVSKPFQGYIKTYQTHADFQWKDSVRPDYLSSSRKRLVPQLLYKGRILRMWKKKIAVALQDNFYATLPALPTVPPQQADIAWLIYTLEIHPTTQAYHLTHKQTVYTKFQAALDVMTMPHVGDVHDFIHALQKKLDEQEAGYPPVNITLLETPSEGEETRI